MNTQPLQARAVCDSAGGWHWVQSSTMNSTPRLSMLQVLACGAAIVTLSMGIRHGFGLWLQPITP